MKGHLLAVPKQMPSHGYSTLTSGEGSALPILSCGMSASTLTLHSCAEYPPCNRSTSTAQTQRKQEHMQAKIYIKLAISSSLKRRDLATHLPLLRVFRLLDEHKKMLFNFQARSHQSALCIERHHPMVLLYTFCLPTKFYIYSHQNSISIVTNLSRYFPERGACDLTASTFIITITCGTSYAIWSSRGLPSCTD